jgi:S1-C subfamily serine protease
VIDGQPYVLGGDIIVAIDDSPVNRFEDLLAYLFNETQPGQTVRLTILRGGERLQVDVTLVSRPSR